MQQCVAVVDRYPAGIVRAAWPAVYRDADQQSHLDVLRSRAVQADFQDYPALVLDYGYPVLADLRQFRFRIGCG